MPTLRRLAGDQHPTRRNWIAFPAWADPIGAANYDVSAGTTSQGYNFSDDASCGFTNTALGDKQNAGSPLLNALAANGGPTETMLPFTPKTNSAASGASPARSCWGATSVRSR